MVPIFLTALRQAVEPSDLCEAVPVLLATARVMPQVAVMRRMRKGQQRPQRKILWMVAKSCTSCWYLQVNHQKPGFLRWCRISSIHSRDVRASPRPLTVDSPRNKQRSASCCSLIARWQESTAHPSCKPGLHEPFLGHPKRAEILNASPCVPWSLKVSKVNTLLVCA